MMGDADSSVRGEEREEVDLPSIPVPGFLTAVGVSVSRLLRGVVRMRFCGEWEERQMREYLAQGMCIPGDH